MRVRGIVDKYGMVWYAEKDEEVFAFIAKDTDENDEGVMGIKTPEGWMPLIGVDMTRVEALWKFADEVSKLSGKSYKILRFKLVGEL